MSLEKGRRPYSFSSKRDETCVSVNINTSADWLKAWLTPTDQSFELDIREQFLSGSLYRKKCINHRFIGMRYESAGVNTREETSG